MRVYVTTYCLTKGIIESDLEDRGDRYYGKLKEGYLANIFNKKEAFESLLDAKVNAEERRKKKIRSLERQIEKLKSMTF